MSLDHLGIDFDATRFVGRQPELERVNKVVAPRSLPAVLHVVGDKGMGKTWFLEKVYKRLRSQEVLVSDAEDQPFISIKIDFNSDTATSDTIFSVQLVSFIRLIRKRFVFIEKELAPLFHPLTHTINRFSNRQSHGPWLEKFIGDFRDAFSSDTLDLFIGLKFGNRVAHQIEQGNLTTRTFSIYEHFRMENKLEELTQALQAQHPNISWDLGNQLDELDRFQRKTALTEIAEELIQALLALSETHGHVLILLDAFEKAPPEIKEWLDKFFLPILLKDAKNITNVSILIAEFSAGRGDFTKLRGIAKILELFRIPKLSDEEVLDYFLTKRADIDIPREEIEKLLETTGADTADVDDIRIPLIMSRKADELAQNPEFDIFDI